MTITVTAKANQHLKNALAKHPDATAIRLGVKTSGCSGYAYVVDYATSPTDVDEILEFDGLQLVVDPISRPLLHGTEVDLVVEGVNRTLRFHNPNVVSECGCGESFAVGAAVPV
ncbi:MAG: iron-sulfur cluster assembly accessory protein [Litorivicinaceae bacterium]|jgi:iron-sulfur cluster assembly protein|nr:iron-sulfur cluster assembly accessory protein [Litorivicinaceae bacterium]MDP5328368.1 iron-sulfur cluster assembly accessory protein [Litorivicinaceae bacterium]MDP5330669.1 iron-sulfur cluster assembly accessory protein [Litorivicinaceae bacterium]MDP5340485.1 iron-sulfur cluster assembly accessory protein [Litorivicinaceae bacterium]MDP5341637.1 iron-sulfur cluster assembly accessory protein [Litorivicinaceae bacterium]